MHSLVCILGLVPVSLPSEGVLMVQTALHLAARRGCMPMLRLLLSTCGPHGAAALRWRDVSGDTPAQLARKKGHGAAEAEIAEFLQALWLAPV
jgi:Ankyrin repeats (many copies)